MLLGGPPNLFRNQESILDNELVATAHFFSTMFLNTRNPPSLLPHMLELKFGQPIILIRKIDPQKGLCDGTRLVVKMLGRKRIQASILSGKWMGQMAMILRVSLPTIEYGTTPAMFN